MDVLVGAFLKEATYKARDGSIKEYESDSLTSLHRGIERYLKENGYKQSLVTSDDFAGSRKVLETRRKELKGKGKGNKPNKADPITPDEEEKMWEVGALGDTDGETLQNTIYYIFGKCFGFRGSDEARQLAWGDVEILVDENGVEYLQWKERLTKTRMGQPGAVREFAPKIWPNQQNTARCPVRLFKLFKSKRPTEALENGTPFYLTVNRCNKRVWYKGTKWDKSTWAT